VFAREKENKKDVRNIQNENKFA